MTAMDISITKEALVSRLNEKRAEAEAFDKKQLAAHRKDERAMLATFRERLREAARWTDAEAKKHSWTAGLNYDERRGANCPTSKVAEYDKVLDALLLDSRKRFTIGPSSELGRLVHWSPEPAAEALC